MNAHHFSPPFEDGKPKTNDFVAKDPNGPGYYFSDGASSCEAALDSKMDTSNIKVVVRVRPFASSERRRDDERLVYVMQDNQSVQLTNEAGTLKRFTFNQAFDDATDQEQMFNECGVKDLIDMALEGYNCTVFAFGQTGSGKTYTITGKEEASDEITEGIIPRSFMYLFDEILKREGSQYIVKASYLEVYNEQVKDLLNPSSTSLPMRWSSTKGFYVENLFVVECEVADDMSAVLEEGLRNRAMGSHDLNEHSSRSHSMLTIYLETVVVDKADGRSYKKHGKISFVDLAGSERVKESHSTGETFNETLNINKSLLCLGNCISALSDGKKKGAHIPFRNSKLTKLLADSLGGDGVTLMIACVTPSLHNTHDTLNTLRYANRAKRIQNRPVVRMDPQEQYIMSLKREIKLLKSENTYLKQQMKGVSAVSPHFDSSHVSLKDGAGSPIDIGQKDSTNSLNEGLSYMLQPMKGTRQQQSKQMLQEYMSENEKLRSENADLYNQGMELSKDHENLMKEYEKLSDRVHHLEKIFLSDPNRREMFQFMTSEHASANDSIDRTESNVRLFLEQNSNRPIDQTKQENISTSPYNTPSTQSDQNSTPSQSAKQHKQEHKLSESKSKKVNTFKGASPKKRDDKSLKSQLLTKASDSAPKPLPVHHSRVQKQPKPLNSPNPPERHSHHVHNPNQMHHGQHDQGQVRQTYAHHHSNYQSNLPHSKQISQESILKSHPALASHYQQYSMDTSKSLSSLAHQSRLIREETLQKLKGELSQLDGEIAYYSSVTHR